MKSHPAPKLAQYPVLPGDRQMALRAAKEVIGSPSGLTPPVWSMKVVGDVPLLALLPIRLVYSFASIAGLLWIMFPIARSRLSDTQRQLRPATVALGVAFHGALVVTAIVEIGFYRYLMPLWPMVCTLVFLAVLSARHLIRRDQAKSILDAPRSDRD